MKFNLLLGGKTAIFYMVEIMNNNSEENMQKTKKRVKFTLIINKRK